MPVWSMGQEDPLEEGMATHFSTGAWRIPWTEEPGGLQSTGSQRVRHNGSNLASTYTYAQYAINIGWSPRPVAPASGGWMSLGGEGPFDGLLWFNFYFWEKYGQRIF